MAKVAMGMSNRGKGGGKKPGRPKKKNQRRPEMPHDLEWLALGAHDEYKLRSTLEDGQIWQCCMIERKLNLRCLVTIDAGHWHMSLAHPTRLPRWGEIYDARYRFMPHKIHVYMALPPLEEYVNVHQFCFHLWQIEPMNLIIRPDQAKGIIRL